MDGSTECGTHAGGDEAIVPATHFGVSVVDRDPAKRNVTAQLLQPRADGKNVPALDTRELSHHVNMMLISPDSVAELASGWNAPAVADLASANLTASSSVREADLGAASELAPPSSSACTAILRTGEEAAEETAEETEEETEEESAEKTAEKPAVMERKSNWLETCVRFDSWNISEESDERDPSILDDVPARALSARQRDRDPKPLLNAYAPSCVATLDAPLREQVSLAAPSWEAFPGLHYSPTLLSLSLERELK